MNGRALITGASAGIGLELARIFAAQGVNLVLVARNQSRLEALAHELESGCGIRALALAQDLSQPDAAETLFARLKDIPVSTLINNAGFGNYGPFAATDLQVSSGMMQVNMTSLVQLTHLFLQPMLAARGGRILNVASTAAFQPGPTMNVYYASKAFVYSFSYALAVELEGTGVTVTALCPGMTRTQFFQRAHIRENSGWRTMDARKVAELGYRGMMRGKRVVIAGVLNQVASFFAKRVPPRLTAAIVKRLHAGVGSAVG
jgi:short-subunit dehydrogenase